MFPENAHTVEGKVVKFSDLMAKGGKTSRGVLMRVEEANKRENGRVAWRVDAQH